MAEGYDFLVIHYQEINGNRRTRNRTELINRERNTTEYNVIVKVPIRVMIADLLHNIRSKYITHTQIDGVGEFVSRRKKDFTRKSIVRAFREEIRQEIDVLYCVDAQREAYWVSCLAEELRIPYIIGEHAPVPWPGTVLTDANKAAIEKADCFLAISEDKIRQMLLQNIRLPEIRYIGNLIDEDQFQLKKRENGKGIKTLIIVAARSFYKNYGMFTAVIGRLDEITDTPYKVIIAGYASNKGYSGGAQEFEEQIRRSSFADKAELIPEIPHEKINEVYQRADAFVMTSIQEGQPVSAMEAACCGLPVFSTRCGGVEDYTDEKTGRIYSVYDTEGMARGLKDFVEGRIEFDPEYIRENVVRRFGKKAFTEHFAEAVETTLAKSKG